MTVLLEMIKCVIAENTRTVIDQVNYEKRYNGLVDKYEEKKIIYDELTAVITDK
jgi:hypothetical protein